MNSSMPPTPQRVTVPPFDEVWPDVAEAAESSHEASAKYTGWNVTGCITVAAMVLGLLLVFGGLLAGEGLVALPGLLMVAVPIVVVLPKVKQLKEQHQESVVGPLVQSIVARTHLDDPVAGERVRLEASYDPAGRLDRRTVALSGIVADADVAGEDLVRGVFGQTDFEFCDLRWMEAPQGGGGPGGEASDKAMAWLQEHASAVGATMVFFSADFHKDFTSRTYLYSRKASHRLRRLDEAAAERLGAAPLRLEGVEFGQLFEGWTTDQVEARYLVTPEMLEAVLRFAEQCGADEYALSFTGSRMNIAVGFEGDRFGLDFSGKGGAREKTEQIYRDFVFYLTMVEHFRLNTRIWSKR